jgi:PASTA domain-containing protein
MTNDVVDERVTDVSYDEDATYEHGVDREWLEQRFAAIEQRLDRAERPPRHRRRRLLHLLTGLVALLALALLLVAAGAAGAWYVMQADERPVPAVVGLQLDQAIARLQDDGFDVNISRLTGTSKPADLVVRQSPVAGVERDDGTTVAVVVSAGETNTASP